MNKKKIIIIICSLTILISITLLISLVIIKNNRIKSENEKKRKEEELRQQEIIKEINDKYSPFINNEYINIEDDELALYFNNVLDTHQKIEELTTPTIDINTIKELDSSIETLNNNKEEVTNIEYEDINNYLNNYEDFAKEKIMEIYNQNEIIQNINNDLEKKEEYINNIDSIISTLQFFKDNKKYYYISNNKIIYKEDSFLENYNKLNLNIPIEKEIDYGKAIPILMYHGINDQPYGNTSLFVGVNDFDNQMKYLHDNGFTTLFLSEIYQAKNYEKPVIVTFDDGYIDNYTNAYPILKKYNIKSNMFVITRWLDGVNCVSPEMVIEMSNSGLVEIGSHTLDHVALAAQSYEKQEEELRESKNDLETLLGKEINTIAYPYGSANNSTFTIAAKYYKFAVTTNSGYNYANTLGNLTLKRHKIPRGMSIGSFKAIVNTE